MAIPSRVFQVRHGYSEYDISSRVFIYLFIYLFIHSFIYLFIYLFIHLFIHLLFIYLFVYLFTLCLMLSSFSILKGYSE